jgi:hypothetical protein
MDSPIEQFANNHYRYAQSFQHFVQLAVFLLAPPLGIMGGREAHRPAKTFGEWKP